MKTHRLFLALTLCSVLFSALLYLGWSYGYSSLGFPLDDAWIHQTYARNLARTGQLSYVPGQPSAGSTSPLWTALLSLGYLLGLDYRLWAYFLGAVYLALTAWTACRLARRLFPDPLWAAPLAGLFCALEWHLVWAAFSGMETILFTWLTLLTMYLYLAICTSPLTLRSLGACAKPGESEGYPLNPAFSPTPTESVGRFPTWWREKGVVEGHPPHSLTCRAGPLFAVAGIVAGLLTLTRPEGLLLAGLVGLALLWHAWREARWRGVWVAAGYGLAFALVISPWLAFNLHVSGQPFPNTFYAKQAEYRSLLSLPLWTRLARILLPTVVGAQILLIPGFLCAVFRALCPSLHNTQHAPRTASLPLLWWLVNVLIYALRLPVDYQHGRYLIPTIPILVIFGSWGTLSLLRLDSSQAIVRALSRAMSIAVLVLLLLFWVIGARAYAADVGFIEGEMVAVAHWLEANTPAGALIAVHDIGTVGYLVDRPLLDLAGLITPEVVPFITDEVQLLAFMEERGADYVVFFPDWSPAYARMSWDPRLHPVYRTGYVWTLKQGGANMVVYKTWWDK